MCGEAVPPPPLLPVPCSLLYVRLRPGLRGSLVLISSVVKLWPTSVAAARGLSRPLSSPLVPVAAEKLPLMELKVKSSREAEKLLRS